MYFQQRVFDGVLILQRYFAYRPLTYRYRNLARTGVLQRVRPYKRSLVLVHCTLKACLPFQRICRVRA